MLCKIVKLILQLCHLRLQLDWARVREREKSIPRVLENVRLCRECICVLWCLVLVSLLLCGGGLFISKGVWQGRTPRLATKVQSTCFTVYWLAADFVGGSGGVSCSHFVCEFAHMAPRRGCGTRLSFHSSWSQQNSSYHFCDALQMGWSNSRWADWQVLPSWTTYTFFSERVRRAWDQVKVQRQNEWLLEAICHSFSTKFWHHHEIFPLSKGSGSSKALPNNGEPEVILSMEIRRGSHLGCREAQRWMGVSRLCQGITQLQKVVKGVLFRLYSLCVNVCCPYVCCIYVSPLCNPSSGRSVTWTCFFGYRLVFFCCSGLTPPLHLGLPLAPVAVNWLAGTRTRNIRHRSARLESWQMGRCWEMLRKRAHAEALCRSHFASDSSNMHY